LAADITVVKVVTLFEPEIRTVRLVQTLSISVDMTNVCVL
jgi:hypothetical protein